MSADQVVSKAVRDSIGAHTGWLHGTGTCDLAAQDVIDELKAAGYAVVALPPRHQGCVWSVDEDLHDDFEDFVVSLVSLQRTHDGATETGAQIRWGSLEVNLSRRDARSLAAALLAAADADEAAS